MILVFYTQIFFGISRQGTNIFRRNPYSGQFDTLITKNEKHPKDFMHLPKIINNYFTITIHSKCSRHNNIK